MTWIFGMLPPVRGVHGFGPVDLGLGMDFLGPRSHQLAVSSTQNGGIVPYVRLFFGVSLT